MRLWKIAWRNLQQRALASSLTGLSMALGVALMVLVLVIHNVVVGQLSNDAEGYHLIVGGGQGSRFEVVLTSVFHLGTPINPIPYSYYEKFTTGEYAPYVEAAVPLCLGDSYPAKDGSRLRVVGTTPDMFTKLSYAAEEPYKFADGHNFKQENFYEAVLGSVAAKKTGLKVGDTFQPSHGITSDRERHDPFTIVGVLAPTGTANDRALFINMEGFYLLPGHSLSPQEAIPNPAVIGSDVATKLGLRVGDPLRSDPAVESTEPDAEPPQVLAVLSPTSTANDRAVFTKSEEFDDLLPAEPSEAHESDEATADSHTPLPKAQREVTSILVLCNSPLAAQSIDSGVNKGGDRTAQAVAPRRVVEQLTEGFLGPMRMILLVLTVLIVVVAGISILVSIYNSMSERSHDIAVMRALGASRTAVMSIVLVESILLALLGGLVGMLLGHGILAIASPVVEDYTGVAVQPWQTSTQEWLLIPGLVAFAALVGLLPAITAYRTDVGKTLGGAR